MHEYDKSSKWLIQHHGDSLLRLAGIADFTSWRALQAELVQPRQLPDGLLEVQLAGEANPDLFLLEIATYPESRLAAQVLRDLMMAFMGRGIVTEILVLVLCPKGRTAVESSVEIRSRLGLTTLRAGWRVIELWTLPAEVLLSAGDVGLLPLVPLANFSGPAEDVLRRCAEQIRVRAAVEERANLLAVAQVLGRLRFQERSLLNLLGGREIMIESPLIQEIEAKRAHRVILRFLRARFKEVPEDLISQLEKVLDEGKLDELAEAAALCKDLKTFAKQLRRK